MKNLQLVCQRFMLAGFLALALALGLYPQSAQATITEYTQNTTVAPLPIATQGAALAWEREVKASESSYAHISDVITLNGSVYVAKSDNVGATMENAVLYRFDAQTGEELGSVELPVALDSVSRLAATDDLILVPAAGGALYAVAADMQSDAMKWNIATFDTSAQSLNGVSVYGQSAYHVSSLLGVGWKASSSSVVAVNTADGSEEWRWLCEGDGAYWSGITATERYALMGSDAGKVYVLDRTNGTLLSETEIAPGASIRSRIIQVNDTEFICSASNGLLVRFVIASDGSIPAENIQSVRFAAASTSTPAVSGTRAVVGGSTADYKGVLAIVDLASMSVQASVAASADVKSTPLVVRGADGGDYAYYTSNTKPGTLYGVSLDDDQAKPFAVNTPSTLYEDYCMASAVTDGQGRVYYTNDSGTVFAIERDATCGYVDITEQDWVLQGGVFERSIQLSLMGRGSNYFRPYDALTRAEAAAILYRAAGEPALSGSSPGFADVDTNSAFGAPILWAQETGVMHGYTIGTFGPNDPITRADLAVVLTNYAQNIAGRDLSNVDTALLERFPDFASVPDYADLGLAWCVSEGIVSGSMNTGVAHLAPYQMADRATMAKMSLLTLDLLA